MPANSAGKEILEFNHHDQRISIRVENDDYTLLLLLRTCHCHRVSFTNLRPDNARYHCVCCRDRSIQTAKPACPRGLREIIPEGMSFPRRARGQRYTLGTPPHLLKSMAQSWITEVSMEIDAETPKAPAPPVPPPPPPEPAPPPAPPAAAPGYTTAPAAPSGVTSSAPQTAATPFYQDPYRSFSQYGAAQQYADPQVSHKRVDEYS